MITNEILYTTGGVLESIAPPGAGIMTARRDRIFIVPYESPTIIWFSKPLELTIAAEFNDVLTYRIDEGGDITGLAIQDDNIVVFKQEVIYVFAGEGPNALGQGVFTPARKIATGIGCVDSNSVVTMKDGTFFKAKKGIYLLTRALEVAYIGAPVEGFGEARVRRALLVSTENQVRFILSTGKTLVYDYYHKLWSTLHDEAVDAVVLDGAVRTLHTSGAVDHPVAAQRFLMETQWLKEKLQGLQRIWWLYLLGELEPKVRLKAELMYDYDETVRQTEIVTKSQMRIKPIQQKCQALKLRLTELPDSVGNIRFSSLGLVVGIKPDRLAKLPEARTL